MTDEKETAYQQDIDRLEAQLAHYKERDRLVRSKTAYPEFCSHPHLCANKGVCQKAWVCNE